MIPLYHDFTDETVLVFGGGSVGARKARRFAREADVVVVSPEFPADDYGDAQRIRSAPDAEAVPEWFDRTAPALAVAATDDPAVNEAIESTARRQDILVNRADHSGGRDAGSVVVPATVRDDEVTVAVSTGGRSPALSKTLRERIEEEIEGAGELAELTAEIRRSLKADGVDPALRRQAVRDVVRSTAVWKDLGEGDDNPRQTADAVVEAALGDRT
jgi:precorrin-2 dehydrogenase/sirohydrochlorin ferrochelatase